MLTESAFASTPSLIGRQRELTALSTAIEAARSNKGGFMLVSGEAGIGKTHLVEEALARGGLLTLVGRASPQTTPPYGLIADILRDYQRQAPEAFQESGAPLHFLSYLLPELATSSMAPSPSSLPINDVNTLLAAICHAFEWMARRQPICAFFDDLQWADNATFQCLRKLAEVLPHIGMLAIGSYRSEEIPRHHPMRQLRTDLRRMRRLHEIAIEPLDRAATAELAARHLGRSLSPALASTLHNRTQGVPLFVEELTNALTTSGHIHEGKAGLELSPGHEVPIPETLRDAVLLRLDGLSEPARKLLEIAAILGPEFDIALLCKLSGAEHALDELFERNWINEEAVGRASFRHALTHEAIYNHIPWTRRRTWHRDVAAHLQSVGALPHIVAEHWLAARELDPARHALLEAAQRSCSMHAYRDAAQAVHRALDIWPKGIDEGKRLDVLEWLGRCAQLSGLHNDAIQAWREVAERRQQDADKQAYAQINRQLAAAYELQGAWDQGLLARQQAAQAFAESGSLEDAVLERLMAAAHLRSAARFRAALDILNVARADVEQTQRWDLKARIMGLEGNVRVKMGEAEHGLSVLRAGLALTMDHQLNAAMVEVYQRLADALEYVEDYATAKDTYQTAYEFCQRNEVPVYGQVCMACLTAVLFHTGEWERAVTVCQSVLDDPQSPAHALSVGHTILGLVNIMRGQVSRARPHLLDANAHARHIELVACELMSAWGLALLEAQHGSSESAIAHCRALLQRWAATEERHYVVPPLRWMTSYLAGLRKGVDARACANALATIMVDTGQPEALSALAHALGEIALLDDDPVRAVQQFTQSLELMRGSEAPFERAHTGLRAGVAHLAAGQREAAVAQFVQAYRLADKLGAKHLADQAAQELAALGEKIHQRLGRRAAGKLQQAGLTRRQLEILKLVARGQTNQEIAQSLFLSARTVEMHVGDILARLDCRTRTEAVHKASELNLLDSAQ